MLCFPTFPTFLTFHKLYKRVIKGGFLSLVNLYKRLGFRQEEKFELLLNNYRSKSKKIQPYLASSNILLIND